MPKKSPFSLAVLRAITRGPLSALVKQLKGTSLGLYPRVDLLPPDEIRAAVLRKHREAHPHEVLLTRALVKMLDRVPAEARDVRHTPLEGTEFALIPKCERKAALYRQILKKHPKDIEALEGLITCLEENALITIDDLRGTQMEGAGIATVRDSPLRKGFLIKDLKDRLAELKKGKAGPASKAKTSPEYLISDSFPSCLHRKGLRIK